MVAHDAETVGADVVDADVVAPDDEDVGFLVGGLREHRAAEERCRCQQGQSVAENSSSFHRLCLADGIHSRSRTAHLGGPRDSQRNESVHLTDRAAALASRPPRRQ